MESEVKLTIEENPDGYGHIGYEHFPKYFRKGLENLFKKMNLDIPRLNKRNLGMWVKTSNYSYNFSLFNRDNVSIYSTISDVSPAIITMKQTMKKDGKVMATSQTEFYCVNLSKTKLIRVPTDIISKLKSLKAKII